MLGQIRACLVIKGATKGWFLYTLSFLYEAKICEMLRIFLRINSRLRFLKEYLCVLKICKYNT